VCPDPHSVSALTNEYTGTPTSNTLAVLLCETDDFVTASEVEDTTLRLNAVLNASFGISGRMRKKCLVRTHFMELDC
jgi:hypothetical protein